MCGHVAIWCSFFGFVTFPQRKEIQVKSLINLLILEKWLDCPLGMINWASLSRKMSKLKFFSWVHFFLFGFCLTKNLIEVLPRIFWSCKLFQSHWKQLLPEERANVHHQIWIYYEIFIAIYLKRDFLLKNGIFTFLSSKNPNIFMQILMLNDLARG